ncbi:PB1 domain-containing protein [Cephalotus follicularis]|uniref:PB1 domain-containing protein n=1 Tax=Cephalotus follicularis TaxID=3775 RepID=A0A1Q3B5J4_CEPFO|nr:PB1 domain-containing protein [Cephalotus follicularis]
MAGEGGEESASSSPKGRVKFMCSHGGKILPRPADGHLKYVGGETRVVAVRRDINFSELMKKLSTIFHGDVVLKYQILPEDLDALVSVKNDEDVKHMIEEHDRHESEGTPKLRAFLFTANSAVIENHMASVDHHAVEQRYIDAINGITRTPTSSGKVTPINANRPSFSINSSACTSPKSTSPDGHTVSHMLPESLLMNGYQNVRFQMHKVHSSPSLVSLNTTPYQSINLGNQPIYQQHHPYYQNHQQHHSHHRPPQDPHIAAVTHERLSPALSMGQAEFARVAAGHGSSHYYVTNRNQLESGGYNRYGHYDECSVHGCARLDRSESLPRTPRKTMWENSMGQDFGLSSRVEEWK